MERFSILLNGSAYLGVDRSPDGPYVLYTDAQRLEEQLEAAVRFSNLLHALLEMRDSGRREDDSKQTKLLNERDAASIECIRLGLGAKLKLEG